VVTSLGFSVKCAYFTVASSLHLVGETLGQQVDQFTPLFKSCAAKITTTQFVTAWAANTALLALNVFAGPALGAVGDWMFGAEQGAGWRLLTEGEGSLGIPMGEAGSMEAGGLAEQAANAQTSAGYNTDAWSNTTLQPGTQLVQGSPGEGSYFTSLDQFQSSGGTLNEYNEGLQINPNPNYAPRQGVTVYQVIETTNAAVSDALANDGAGGWTQFYIPNQSGLCAVYCIPFVP
jgi:hypothetical protein